ncbi:MAG: alpha/beta hydrolase [Akkermansiaceae bacterium]|nr:alpha/beta hydrolase [Akkermansiaceae bacterium]NNM30436.1 alpha/beta hydrolase [Akkermansiaceae bacterium]
MKTSAIAFLAILTLPLGAQTSETDERLQRFLERFPASDADKDGVLTRDEVRAFNRTRRADQPRPDRAPAPKPTHADVSYGDHPQQAFDIWLAKRDDGKPAPLCIFIHGGGFRGGDKRSVPKTVIDRFLREGISFASMNYRLTNGGEFPYPTAMHDAARGLQFIRSRAKEWNLDPDRIASFGGSAGAGISLWLAFHDDLADPDSDDPVARQSTRLVAAGTTGGQSTYDMRTFREWFGVPDLKPHDALVDFYAMKEDETPDTPRVAKLAEDASPITHLTADDVPVHMSYNRPNTPVTAKTGQGEWVHHALLGLKLQEAMKKLGLECIVVHPGLKDETYPDLPAFLIAKLTAATEKE